MCAGDDVRPPPRRKLAKARCARHHGPVQLVIVHQGEPLSPFGRRAAECVVGNSSLAEYRRRTARRLRLACGSADLEEELVGPCVVMADDVFVTRRALRGFLAKAKKAHSARRLCLPPSRLLELFLPLQDVPLDEGRAAFDIAYLPAGERASPAALFALPASSWLAPPYRELALDVPLPRHLLGTGDDVFTFPLTSTIALRVRHWVHVLRLGHLMPQVELLERAEDRPLTSMWRSLLALRLSRPALRHGLATHFNHRGRGVFVHPTATVEASVLGDGVRIGAYAYVVGSVLGDGVIVEQRAHVEQSCLGPRTFVSKNSTVSACVAFGDTDVCVNGIQTCVIAERCGLTSWARPLDTVPGAQVQVQDEGTLRSVGSLPCGVAFGPDVFVGAGVDIAPGRAIPGGLRLVSDPSRVLSRPPLSSSPGEVGFVEGGAVRPLARRS